MATARQVIEDALSLLGVRAAETSVTAAEVADGLRVLNDMLEEWAASQVIPGVGAVADASDTIQAPRYADGAIKANLALRLAAPYGREAPQMLIAQAVDASRNLARAQVSVKRSYPPTLPWGSGNQIFDTGEDPRFAPDTGDKNF
jgi:hypothetical protein